MTMKSLDVFIVTPVLWLISYTVEPPSNGTHRENDVGLLLGGCRYSRYVCIKSSIGIFERCRYSEVPLWEVYLYTASQLQTPI